MLYLISGASRSGKTLLAQRMMQQRGLPYLSTDWLVMGFTDGIPEYGIHDKLFPDEIAERLWSFLEAMLDNMLWSGIDYVIEGEAMLPDRIGAAMTRYPGRISACFLGYTDVAVTDKLAQIRRHSDDTADWLTRESDRYIRDHIRNMITHSREIEASCARHGLRYIDTSTDLPGALDRAENYLLAQQ